MISRLWFKIQYYFSVQTRLRKLEYRSFDKLSSDTRVNILAMSMSMLPAFSLRVNWKRDFKRAVKRYNKKNLSRRKLLLALRRLGFSKSKAYIVKRDIHNSFKEIYRGEKK